MATIDEMRAYLKEKYHAAEYDNGGMATKVEFDDGRSQNVYFTFPSGDDERPDHLLVAAPFAKVGSISEEDAIEVTSLQTLGGLQRLNGFYFIANTLFLEDVDESEIYNTIFAIASVADIYEQTFGLGDEL